MNNYDVFSTTSSVARRDRLVVRTLRCGRSNPGSNPGPGSFFFILLVCVLFFLFVCLFVNVKFLFISF